MSMKRNEDMNSPDIETMVSKLLGDENAYQRMPKLGDYDALWDMLNSNKSSGKSGFVRGKTLNIICVGGIKK